MTEELSDLDSIEKHQIQLGKKHSQIKEENKSEKKKKPKKRNKKNLNQSIELIESDSKEYIEEEEEESGELSDTSSENKCEDGDESISNKYKKRKIEENIQAPGWERTWKKNNNDNQSISSNSAIVVNINKTAKNKETNNDDEIEDIDLGKDSKKHERALYEKYASGENNNDNNNKLNNDSSSLNNFKKTNFIITSPENNNNIKSNYLQNKYIFNQTRINLHNNQLANNLNYPEIPNREINQYINEKKYYFNNNRPSYSQSVQNSTISQSQPQNKTVHIPIPLMFQGHRLCMLMTEKYRKYGMNLRKSDHEQILNMLSIHLTNYIRTYILRLITISRIRNVNFHLYSNNPNGQIHYKFRTYNYQLSEDKKNISFTKSKNFEILFTSNLKKDMDLIEEYVELNNKKIKFEKLSACKEKDEENEKTKGIETSIKITEGPNPTIKLLPGRRTKKKNNSLIKEVRKKLVQTQKKEDLIKQNSNTKNTLDAFLNDSEMYHKSKNKGKIIDSLLDYSQINNKIDMSSRKSDNMSNIFSYTNINQAKNEIDMNVFNNFDPTKNVNIGRGQKRRINLKDFIFLLENSNEFIPRKSLILNKASFEHLHIYN